MLAKLRAWKGQSDNRRIFAAMVTVGGLTVLVKLITMVKEMAIARGFGVGDAMDAYFIAFLLPSFAVNVIAGSFNSALLPTYIQVRERHGGEQAQNLVASVMVWNLGLLLSVSALLALLFPAALPLILRGASPDKLALTQRLFLMLLPVIPLSGLGVTWAALLNARDRFALAAIVPIITPVISLGLLFWVRQRWGVYVLACGTVAGAVLEAVLLSLALKGQKMPLRPRWHGMDDNLREVMRQYAPMAAGAFMMSGTNLVDQSMAAMLGSGSVAALNYGNRLVAFVLNIASTAIGVVVLPHFSRMVAYEDWRGIGHTLRIYSRCILLVSVPLTGVLIFLSTPIAGLFYQHGAFTAQNAYAVGRIQAFYLIQIPAGALGVLGVRLISALTKNNVIFVIASVNLVLDVVLNLVFMHFFGVAGIAFSTSLVYVFSCASIFVALWIQLGKRKDCL